MTLFPFSFPIEMGYTIGNTFIAFLDSKVRRLPGIDLTILTIFSSKTPTSQQTHVCHVDPWERKKSKLESFKEKIDFPRIDLFLITQKYGRGGLPW